MKKIILTSSFLAFSICVFAQNSKESTQGRPVPEATTTATPTNQSEPRPNSSQTVTPSSTPAVTPATAPAKPKPIGTPPPAGPNQMTTPPKPANSGDYDNGQHKNKGKHKGQIKHDNDTNKVKKKKKVD